MEFYFFLFLAFYSLQGLQAGPPVHVTPGRIILLENKPLEVRCRVPAPITYCRFSVPGIQEGLSLRPSIPAHMGIKYIGEGLDKGECGMLIQRVSSKYSGTIQCSMGFNDTPTESTGNLTLIVAKPPDPPILSVAPGVSTVKDAFHEGEVIRVNCKIPNARPIANISWFLGSEPITDNLGHPAVSVEENGLMTISQNLTRKVTYVDHGKDLKCIAGHIALGQGNINHSIHKINVLFPPKPKSQELEKFGFTIGQPGRIVVTFQANPIPDIVWKVDQDNLKQGFRDRTGRFEAGILQHRGAGIWDAILNINTVRAEEVEKRYTLVAQNEYGREAYKVAISTSPEPPADITAGAIVGIVIAVLVILLLVFILIFARATGRWCFAGGVPRLQGESSDTESADHGSADKSSMSKLTTQKQPKKLMSGLFGSFKKGKTKERVVEADLNSSPPSLEITVKEQPEEVHMNGTPKAEGIVYAELDMARSGGNLMRRDEGEKTEYAEIIYPSSKLMPERAVDELRKSRENLVSSRENQAETEEAFTTTITPDGKKEAAV